MGGVLRDVVGGGLGFGVVGAVLFALERARPATRAVRADGSRRVDLLHVALGRLTAVPANVASFVSVAIVALLLGWRWRHAPFEAWFAHRTAAFASMPRAAQIAFAIVVIDLLGYGIHRLFHERPFWRFHAVHHSSTRLDWLASARNHPVAEILSRVFMAPAIVYLGVDPRVVAAASLPFGIWALFVHANVTLLSGRRGSAEGGTRDVRWTFGALRYVVATPLFHRWHHAKDPEALGKNFAGLLPLWDILFGTFHCPLRQPTAFGTDEPVPQTFLAQLASPFRRGPRATPAMLVPARPHAQRRPDG